MPTDGAAGRPRRVVLVRAGALGDLLLLRPTLARLRAAGWGVSVLGPAGPGSVLCGPDAADVVLPLDGPELAQALASGFGDGPVARALATADAVVAYTGSAPLLAALRARARRLITHEPAPPGGRHAGAWLAAAVAPLAPEPVAAPAPLAFTPAEHSEAERLTRGLPQRFLALHPGSGSASKNWPRERFLDAAHRLSGGRPWLWVTGPAEAAAAVPEGTVHAREWPLRVLGAALARAGLYLGNDSGVSHLAAAAGAPTLALFGPTDPAAWAPIGPRVETVRGADATLAALDVERVVAAAERLRSAASGPPSG